MPEPETRQWTALAFDYGRTRIGVAAGDSVTRRARPLTTLHCGAAGIDWPAINRVVNEWRPAFLVVGVPLNADGSRAELTRPAEDFARDLGKQHAIPVQTVDERFSSLEAADELRTARASGWRSRRVRREDVDAAAACVILERWFDRTAQANPAPSAPPTS
jgi:putative Holliday junction resolvase